MTSVTLERIALVALAFINAAAGVVAADQSVDPSVHLAAAAVVAGCGAALVFMNSWSDAGK